MKIQFNAPPSHPDEVNGLKVDYAPTQRPFAKWRFQFVLVLFLLPFISYAIYTVYNYIVITESGFILLKTMKIKTPTEGVVSFIEEPGTEVKKGDLLCILTNKFLEAEYTNYKNKLKFNEKNIKETIANNRMSLEIARTFYNERRIQHNKIKDLRRRGTAKELEVANSLVQLQSAQLAYTNAKNTLESSKLALKDVYLDRMKIDELKIKLDALSIKSPNNGTIGSIDVQVGELLSQYEGLMSVNIENSTTVEVFLSPEHVKYAKIGQELTLIFPSDFTIPAKVSKINIRAVKTPTGLRGSFLRNYFSIALEVTPQEEIPAKYLINYLPIKARFNFFN